MSNVVEVTYHNRSMSCIGGMARYNLTVQVDLDALAEADNDTLVAAFEYVHTRWQGLFEKQASVNKVNGQSFTLNAIEFCQGKPNCIEKNFSEFFATPEEVAMEAFKKAFATACKKADKVSLQAGQKRLLDAMKAKAAGTVSPEPPEPPEPPEQVVG